ncbi:PH domain-containing protein [Streptosporangium sp. NBC_01469]|uniref:PH domain-containing protein n=1 Tax=Streptosporangium sp. NBC_01469 TaxID=2903898 RepID=UPI002E2932D2|nr:PH domain-containing protein [Streptosporangium sp. NBC_01469]
MKQVFRSNFAMIVGWVWMAFAAFSAVDLIVRYSGRTSMIAAAVLGVLTALVFVTCLRPAVILSEEGVRVRNPLRNAFVPWRDVDEVTVSHSITITSGGESVRCWVPQASARERAAAARRGKPASVPARGRFRTEPVRSKGEQAAAEALAGRTHADWVAEQITERTEAARRAASVTGAPKATGTSGATGTPATTRVSATTGTSAVAGASTTTGGEPEAGTAAGIGSAAGTAAGAGALKVTWAPDALAAFAVAVLPVVAAFLA